MGSAYLSWHPGFLKGQRPWPGGACAGEGGLSPDAIRRGAGGGGSMRRISPRSGFLLIQAAARTPPRTWLEAPLNTIGLASE